MDRDLRIEFSAEIKEAIQKIAESRAALIEEYCERSLLDPLQRGVLVEDKPESGDLRVSLDSSVPYGRIYYKSTWTIGGTGN